MGCVLDGFFRAKRDCRQHVEHVVALRRIEREDTALLCDGTGKWIAERALGQGNDLGFAATCLSGGVGYDQRERNFSPAQGCSVRSFDVVASFTPRRGSASGSSGAS